MLHGALTMVLFARNKLFLWGRVRSVKKWLKVHTHLQVATFPSHKAKDPHEGRTTKKRKEKKTLMIPSECTLEFVGHFWCSPIDLQKTH